MQDTLFYALLMLIAGIGVPTMASLNAGLGAKLNNPILAVVILLSIALLGASVLLLATQGMPETAIYSADIPKYLYLGGLFFVLYICSVTWVIPKFGVANAIGVVLLGQLIAMTIIDHFGLFGLLRYEVSLKRLCGLAVMAFGIFLVVSKPAQK